MPTQLATLTRDDWINKAKESDAEYTHCFVPVITLSYMHDVHPIDRDVHCSFKTFIDAGGITKLKDQLRQSGLNVLYWSDTIVATLFEVQNNNNGPSLEDQFLKKQRNIFIIDISDSAYTYKNISIVCEYVDVFDPLAEYTVNYAEVERQEQSKQVAANFVKRIREKRIMDDTGDQDLW